MLGRRPETGVAGRSGVKARELKRNTARKIDSLTPLGEDETIVVRSTLLTNEQD